MSKEQLKTVSIEHDAAPELEKQGREQQERLRSHHEATTETLEKTRENTAELQGEALKHATKAEKKRNHEQAKAHKREKSPEVANKKQRQKAYKNVMDKTQTQLSTPSKAFSKVIHAPGVEQASEIGANTIARPNAIFMGALMAFLVTLIVYIIARIYGYPLSGSESIIAFAAGWVLGIVFDYLRLIITGKHSS